MLGGIILPSITYHARPGVAEARVGNVIKFPNSHCPGLRRGGYFDNGYYFSKVCFIASKIL